MDNKLMDVYLRWCSHAVEDSDLTAELKQIEGREDAISDRFFQELAFGTGGLRGVIGAGSNRMNIYTVRKASAGLAAYIKQQREDPAVAVSYDSRLKSALFALQAARVFGSYGIKVYLYPQLMPTPALSYAVRRMQCTAGVMVTASHNPAQYNGYKVYGGDGCQITLEAADIILAHINKVDCFDVPCRPEADLRAEGWIMDMPPEVEQDFYAEEMRQRLEDGPAERLSIVYTPLNGSGLVPVTTVLKKAGYHDLTVVENQRDPDGHFPTCPYPNPEMPQALEEGLKVCRERKADLLLATDPDCDRVGIAVRHGEEYRTLTGNEVGVLLLDYICSLRTRKNTMPERPVAVKTIVTTEMAVKVAEGWGVELRNVLTGFKFIGEQIGMLEKDGEADRYILGFEESYGYLSGSHVRDKDAVNASLLICDMAAWYKAWGMDLADAMERLYHRHGYCVSNLSSFAFEGESGFAAMQQLMKRLRANPPASIGGTSVRGVIDYLYESEAVCVTGLPSSDVLQFLLQDETLVTIRPSGTEPKIKIYVSVIRPKREDADKCLKNYSKALIAFIYQD